MEMVISGFVYWFDAEDLGICSRISLSANQRINSSHSSATEHFRSLLRRPIDKQWPIYAHKPEF